MLPLKLVICMATVDGTATVVAARSMTLLLEDYNDWASRNILPWKNANVRGSVLVNFTGMETQCCELSLAVPNEAGHVLGLALHSLDELQEPREAKKQMATL